MADYSGKKNSGLGRTSMANLIMPDTFEPYYAGREDEAEAPAKARSKEAKQPERQADGEIILPEAAPPPEGVTRRERRPVAH
jgi:hypothetical protein